MAGGGPDGRSAGGLDRGDGDQGVGDHGVERDDRATAGIQSGDCDYARDRDEQAVLDGVGLGAVGEDAVHVAHRSSGNYPVDVPRYLR